MNQNNISVIIPSYNNLRHLKNCYESLKRHAPNVEICIADDASTDGTWEWLNNLNDKNLKFIRSEDRVGHTILYDKLIVDVATKDIVSILHADMIIAPNYFENLIKHLNKGVVVCATRIEPPLHPPGKEKIIMDFGIDFDTLSINDFESYVLEMSEKNKDTVTFGMFAPWILYKEDFIKSTGHDPLFAPFPYEDSDIFQRWILHNFKLIQSRDSFVYHLTCRGHRWNEEIGKDDLFFKQTELKARKNFIRKWGCFVLNDEYQYPIIQPRYLKSLEIINNEYSEDMFLNLLDILEPFFDEIMLPKEYTTIENIYINNELNKFNIDVSNKFIKEFTMTDIIVTINNLNLFNNNDMSNITMLPKIIEESGLEDSTFILGNLKIKINKMKNYINNLKTIKENYFN